MMAHVTLLTRDDVPCIDLLAYREGRGRDQEIAKLRRSIDELGFLLLETHPVDIELLRTCYRVGAEFFDLSAEDKGAMDHRRIDQKQFGNIGYYTYMLERAVDAAVADLKEFYHIGPLIDEHHPMSRYYPINVWPERPPAFRACFEELYRQMEECGKLVVDLIGAALDLDRGYLQELLWVGNSILRMLHYPVVESALAAQGAMRAAPHTGINLIGLLPAASHPGLQFCTPGQQWVSLDPALHASSLAVNMGEMLGFLMPSRVRPTLHRVVNSQAGEGNERRFSIVCFVHPNSTAELVPIDAAGQPQRERAISAGDWLVQRLADIKIRA
jgi:isopenicillin N synthase-like dioxygenase